MIMRVTIFLGSTYIILLPSLKLGMGLDRKVQVIYRNFHYTSRTPKLGTQYAVSNYGALDCNEMCIKSVKSLPLSFT